MFLQQVHPNFAALVIKVLPWFPQLRSETIKQPWLPSHLPGYLAFVAHPVLGGLQQECELASKAAGILGTPGRDQIFGLILSRKSDSSQLSRPREYAAG